MSFYIRLNKSVMTFDGLISAYVCFLKMAREERGKGEGKEAVEERHWPPGRPSEEIIGPLSCLHLLTCFQYLPSSPTDFFFFSTNASTLAWFLGCLRMLSNPVSLCLCNLWCNLNGGSGWLSHKFKDGGRRQTWLRWPGLLYLRAIALLNTQFPYVLPPFPLMSWENWNMFHTRTAQADADAPPEMIYCLCTASSRPPYRVATWDSCSLNYDDYPITC